MAELNFTQGGFRGKVGVHYGSRSKGVQKLSMCPLITPRQTAAQTASVRAFEVLNRSAGAMARTNFATLGLRTKRLHAHNVVAKLLSPLLQNHSFSWSNFASLGKIDNSVILAEFFEDVSNGTCNVVAQTLVYPNHAKFSAWWVLVFDSTGRVAGCFCPKTASLSAQFLRPLWVSGALRAVVFRTEKRAGGVHFYGFASSDLPLIENETLYASRSVAPSGWRVENGVLFASASVASVSDSILFAK